MPRKREVEDLEKVTLNLFKGDFKTLQDLHPYIGAGKAIRTLVRKHILTVKEKANGHDV